MLAVIVGAGGASFADERLTDFSGNFHQVDFIYPYQYIYIYI